MMVEANETNIDAAVRDADLRVLVMCLFQITGDRKWLAEPYLPQRDVRLIAPEDAGFSDEIAEQLWDAAIAEHDTTPVISDPGDELMVEMMSALSRRARRRRVRPDDARGNGICVARH